MLKQHLLLSTITSQTTLRPNLCHAIVQLQFMSKAEAQNQIKPGGIRIEQLTLPSLLDSWLQIINPLYISQVFTNLPWNTFMLQQWLSILQNQIRVASILCAGSIQTTEVSEAEFYVNRLFTYRGKV